MARFLAELGFALRLTTRLSWPRMSAIPPKLCDYCGCFEPALVGFRVYHLSSEHPSYAVKLCEDHASRSSWRVEEVRFDDAGDVSHYAKVTYYDARGLIDP